MRDVAGRIEPSTGVIIGACVSAMYLKASGLTTQTHPPFPTMLDKNRELGTCTMTRIDGANFLKRRLKEADIVGLLHALLQGDGYHHVPGERRNAGGGAAHCWPC